MDTSTFVHICAYVEHKVEVHRCMEGDCIPPELSSDCSCFLIFCDVKHYLTAHLQALYWMRRNEWGEVSINRITLETVLAQLLLQDSLQPNSVCTNQSVWYLPICQRSQLPDQHKQSCQLRQPWQPNGKVPVKVPTVDSVDWTETPSITPSGPLHRPSPDVRHAWVQVLHSDWSWSPEWFVSATQWWRYSKILEGIPVDYSSGLFQVGSTILAHSWHHGLGKESVACSKLYQCWNLFSWMFITFYHRLPSLIIASYLTGSSCSSTEVASACRATCWF